MWLKDINKVFAIKLRIQVSLKRPGFPNLLFPTFFCCSTLPKVLNIPVLQHSGIPLIFLNKNEALLHNIILYCGQVIQTLLFDLICFSYI